MNHRTPGLPVHHQLPESTQTHIHWVSDAIQPSHPLSSPSPPAPNLPSIRVFPNESALLIRWPKYWSFSFNISPSNEHPGLISFRMDWLDLLAAHGTLKSLLQHHSSKAPILRCSAFFIVQLSHPYITPGKTIALTRRTFVGKVMSLLFNMLSTDYSEPYSSHLWNADDICPLGCHKVQVVYPHKLFSTVSICGQVFTKSKQFISSILRPTCFHIFKNRLCLEIHGISQSPWTMAVVTQLSQPVQEETWSKLFILLSLPCLHKYQIALSIRIKKNTVSWESIMSYFNWQPLFFLGGT